MKIIAILGSLRKDSYNRQLAEEAVSLLPEGVEMQLVDGGNLPLFNQDLEFPAPAAVAELRQQVKEADALWFFTPEYNHSLPGVLKNTIDWLSRPEGQGQGNVLDGKIATYSGAGFGLSGSTSAQDQLAMVLSFLNVVLQNNPRTTIPLGGAVDSQGKLNLEPSRKFLQQQVDAFIPFIKMVQEAAA